MDRSFSLNAIATQVSKGLAATDNGNGTYTIDLFAWYGKFDHDASLMRLDKSHEDPQPQFDQGLLDDLTTLSEDGETITKEMLAEHQRNAIMASRMQSPDDYNIPVNTCGTQATFTMLFGQDDNLDTADLAFVESFMKDNRIPEGYMTREERGVPNLLSTDEAATLTNEVRAFFNTSIESALAMDMDDTMMGNDTMIATIAPEEDMTEEPEDDAASSASSMGDSIVVASIAGISWSSLVVMW